MGRARAGRRPEEPGARHDVGAILLGQGVGGARHARRALAGRIGEEIELAGARWRKMGDTDAEEPDAPPSEADA